MPRDSHRERRLSLNNASLLQEIEVVWRHLIQSLSSMNAKVESVFCL
jgi:hypothetical protein